MGLRVLLDCWSNTYLRYGHGPIACPMLCYATTHIALLTVDNMSPYELVFGHKASISVDLEVQINSVVSGNFKDYHDKLKKNLAYMR